MYTDIAIQMRDVYKYSPPNEGCNGVCTDLSHDTLTIHCSNRSIKLIIQLISIQMSMHSGITSYPIVLTAYRILSQ